MSQKLSNDNPCNDADTSWQPTRFAVGNLVMDVDRPQWGKGKVIEDRTRRCSPNCGQRLYVDFEHRGLVMIYTAMRVLKLADA